MCGLFFQQLESAQSDDFLNRFSIELLIPNISESKVKIHSQIERKVGVIYRMKKWTSNECDWSGCSEVNPRKTWRQLCQDCGTMRGYGYKGGNGTGPLVLGEPFTGGP